MGPACGPCAVLGVGCGVYGPKGLFFMEESMGGVKVGSFGGVVVGGKRVVELEGWVRRGAAGGVRVKKGGRGGWEVMEVRGGVVVVDGEGLVRRGVRERGDGILGAVEEVFKLVGKGVSVEVVFGDGEAKGGWQMVMESWSCQNGRTGAHFSVRDLKY